MILEDFLEKPFNIDRFREFIAESLGFGETLHVDFTSLGNIEYKPLLDNSFLSDGRNQIKIVVLKTEDDILNARVKFNHYIEKSNIADDADMVLMALYNENDLSVWKLSLAVFSKNKAITSSKRYTFELGAVPHKTALEQLSILHKSSTLEQYLEAFATEKISNIFFKEYKGLYSTLIKRLEPEIALFDGEEENLKLFTKKLLGRVVFLYFLQKKGWLGSQKEWGDGDKKFMSKLFENNANNDFYAKILNPIFFEALNIDRKKNNDYFELLNCKMPFLNGGLFSPTKFDIVSEKNFKPLILLENSDFENIFKTFDSYNFTIIEDTPHDSEVAIDPEMLGRVFEDLLEDRKDKGAFYTPREIVHYMAKKSIENYLQTEVKEYRYDFSVDEFLKKVSLSDEKILQYYQSHPVKFVKLENYFTKLLPYKNLVIDFWIVAKLKGFRLDVKGQRKKTDRGHPTVTRTIWKKILEHNYETIDINFGSNKEIKLSKIYHYPTITKYVKIDKSYFTLAFLPNIWGDLELTTIFPVRQRAIKNKLKKFDKSLNELNEKSFAFNSEVFSKIKELREDCRSLHPEPLSTFKVEELPRQAVVQKGLSTFQNSFNVDSIADDSLKIFLKDKDYYNKTINKLLNNSIISQDELKKIMIFALRSIKTLDPAIGSGAFPMGVLHELLETRVKLGDKTHLSKMKREIIENNIYGIDIEESAVEIAKLRFWISIVVDEKEPQPLPNLDYKILIGNSLIETINGFDPLDKNVLTAKSKRELNEIDKKFHQFFSATCRGEKSRLKKDIDTHIKAILSASTKKFNTQGTFESKTKKELKEFEENFAKLSLLTQVLKEYNTKGYSQDLFFYKLYFKEVMDKGGFDLIIGNPPYLRVQGINKESSNQYKKVFNSATGSYDLYVLFTEKGLELLSKNGILNYIMPHKWINASFGKGLREIAKDKVSNFISFGAYQVFNASTYTSLVWWQNNKTTKHLNYIELDKNLDTNKELENYLFNLKDDDYTKIKNSDLTSANWTFTDKQTYEILERLKEQPLRVKDVFEKIFQGLATSKDSVYFLKKCRYDGELVKAFSDELQKEIIIEKGLTKPLLKGDDVHRYEKISTDKVVIFPYYLEIKDEKETAILYTENELEKMFPNGYTYLKQCETILRGREKGRLKNDDFWYKYIYPKNLIQFHYKKLIQPDISLGGNFSYDEAGEFYQTTTLYGYRKFDKIKESYKFYMSIFNSKLLWWYLTKTGTVLTNNYFRFKPDYLNPFPLPKIKNIQDIKPFEILVDEIIKLKEQNIDTKKLEDEIDKMVYKLYDLSDEEIKIIEIDTKEGNKN